jgi:hypothetical protein
MSFFRRKPQQKNESDAGDSDDNTLDSGEESDASAESSESSSSSSSSTTTTKAADPESKKVKVDKTKGRMAKSGGGSAFYGTVRKGQRFKMKNALRNRRIIAAEIIQRYVRGFLWRRAEERRLAREARIDKERNIRHVRRRQMERDYWWDADVDTDELHRCVVIVAAPRCSQVFACLFLH